MRRPRTSLRATFGKSNKAIKLLTGSFNSTKMNQMSFFNIIVTHDRTCMPLK